MARDDVFINGRFLTQPMSGVQRYAAEIVTALDAELTAGRLPDDRRWTLVMPDAADPLPLRAVATRRLGRWSDHRWDQWTLARATHDGRLLSLASSGPVLHRDHLVVVHDAAVYRHPEHFSRAYRAFHTTAGRLLARTARLATVSAFSQAELSQLLGLPAAAITVAPNGWEHLSRLVPDRTIADSLTGGTPFFVTVGNLTRNKNLEIVIRAHRRLPRGLAKLVVVGRADARVFGARPLAGDENVIFAGRLDDSGLAGLLAASRALVFPSLYEGFGIPPLEAMAAGTRVIASRAAAVREVCEGVADLFEATDDAALAALMMGVLAEAPGQREARLAAGHERLRRYSWAASARILAAALLGEARPGAAGEAAEAGRANAPKASPRRAA